MNELVDIYVMMCYW